MRRQRLAVDASAASVADAATSMVVLHATDPATVYLSALARCPDASLADVTTALYDDRSVVKVLGMRRTMFVAPRGLVPVIHGAAGIAVADRLRRRLTQDLRARPTEPEVGADVERWLSDVEDATERAVLTRGSSLANESAVGRRVVTARSSGGRWRTSVPTSRQPSPGWPTTYAADWTPPP